MVGWRRKGQATPGLLPGKFCGQRSLVGYSPCSCKVRHDVANQQQQSMIGFCWGSSSRMQTASFSFSHGRKREEDLSRVSFTRALIPFTGSPPSWPNHCPKPLPPNIIASKAKISTYTFKGDTGIQTVTQRVMDVAFDWIIYWEGNIKMNPVINPSLGTSLVVQCLRLCAPNVGGPGLILGQGTKSHIPQFKDPHAATKTWSNKYTLK